MCFDWDTFVDVSRYPCILVVWRKAARAFPITWLSYCILFLCLPLCFHICY